MNTQMIDPVKVARDLTEILRIDEELLTQAVHQASAQVDGHSLPGGLAMIALAPVANIVDWQRRVDLEEAKWFNTPAEIRGRRPDRTDVEDDDTEPPLQLLRFWTDHYRRVRGADWDHVPTLHTEASFLKHELTWILDREPQVVAFARDVNRARVRLENMLMEGRRPERSRVTCDRTHCEPRARQTRDGIVYEREQLVRVRATAYVTGWTCATCATTVDEERHCETCNRRYPASNQRRCDRQTAKMPEPCGGRIISTATEHGFCFNPTCPSFEPPGPAYASDDDYWKCPACKTRYTATEYAAAYAGQLRRDDRSQRYVLVADAVNMLATDPEAPRAESTVRRWLGAPRIHTADRCTRCRARWAPDEHNVCPKPVIKLDPLGDPIRKIVDGRQVYDQHGHVVYETEPCGGELRPAYTGDPDAVIEGYCDLATRKAYVWWPDLWTRHLRRIAEDEAATARRARQAAAEAEWHRQVDAGEQPWPTAERLGIHPRRVKTLLEQRDSERSTA